MSTKILFVFLFSMLMVYSQNFESIKLKTDNYPRKTNLKELRDLISNDFNTEEEQVKAIYCWVTKNIRYDVKEYYKTNRPKTYQIKYRDEKELKELQKERTITNAKKVLRTNKAICQGYTDVVYAICDALDIKSETVKGNIRNGVNEIDTNPIRTNHVWNVILINDKWMHIDATWGAGVIINRKWKTMFNPYFYDMPHKTFFKTHYPRDGKWRLLIGRISKLNFYRQPIYYPKGITSNIKIKSKFNGTLSRENGVVSFTLENIKKSSKIFIGLEGSRYAIKPIIKQKGNTKIVTIKVPKYCNYLNLIIDGESFAKFKVI